MTMETREEKERRRTTGNSNTQSNSNRQNQSEDRSQQAPPSSDALDYCMILDMTFNDPPEVSDQEFARLVEYYDNKMTGASSKLEKDQDLRTLSTYVKLKKDNTLHGAAHVLFRITIQGNPKLLKWVQKFIPKEGFSKNKALLNTPVPREADEIECVLDQGYYLKEEYTRTLSLAVPINAENHIYSILFYDCPRTSGTVEDETYFARRDLFVTYAKSTIPDGFDEQQLRGYDKVRISWEFIVNFDTADISNCVVRCRLARNQKIRYGDNPDDRESETDWAAITKLLQSAALQQR